MEELITVNCKICKSCKLNKESDEFIGSQEDCFKCVYKRKVLEAEIEPPKGKVCKICKKPVKQSRWIYCSKECLEKSKEDNKHWTSQVKGKGWRDYRKFDFRRTTPSRWGPWNYLDVNREC